MKTLITLLFTLLLSLNTNAQDYVGLYVNDFDNIIGNTAAEDELLNYAQTNGFNYLILYRLNQIHNTMFSIDDAVASTPLSNFIENAKLNYGILKVAAVGEKNSSFDKIKTYNSFFPAGSYKKFDVFNLEFEYWNSGSVAPGGYYCNTYLDGTYPCTIAGAFDFYINQLALLKTYGDANNILIETYIGSLLSDAQVAQLVTNTHRILVHYYRQRDIYNAGDADPSNDYSIYQYPSGDPDRIKRLAENISIAGEMVTVMPIFSARHAHMYDWLLTHPLTQPYDTYINGIDGFNEQVGTWKSQVNFDGYVWYRYTELAEIYSTLATAEYDSYEMPYVFYNKLEKRLYFNGYYENSKASVYDMSGRIIDSFKIENSQAIVNLNKGLYIIKVQKEKEIRNTKIVIH